MTFAIDTHSLVWFLQDSRKLSLKKKQMIETAGSGEIIIPVIVIAELMHIAGRVKMDFMRTLDAIEDSSSFSIQPLTVEIIRLAAGFDAMEMHDALIMATARLSSAALMTSDQEIIRSGLVKVV